LGGMLFLGTGGLDVTRPICGTIAVERRARLAKVDKVMTCIPGP
jgi:hypothetical protein